MKKTIILATILLGALTSYAQSSSISFGAGASRAITWTDTQQGATAHCHYAAFNPVVSYSRTLRSGLVLTAGLGATLTDTQIHSARSLQAAAGLHYEVRFRCDARISWMPGVSVYADAGTLRRDDGSKGTFREARLRAEVMQLRIRMDEHWALDLAFAPLSPRWSTSTNPTRDEIADGNPVVLRVLSFHDKADVKITYLF